MPPSTIRLSPKQRRSLEQLATTSTGRMQQRVQIVLVAAAGKTDREVAADLKVAVSTVRLWRARFAERGIDGLADRPRSGRPSTLAPEHTEEPGSDPTLERLLEAAATTISRRGFASTRVSDIAAEAGVSPATVHYYFSTKDKILVHALLWANARPLARLEELSTTGTPVERLGSFLARSIPHPGPRRAEYLLEIDLWSRIRMQPELLAVWEDYNERWVTHLRDILEDAARDGSFTLVAPVDEVAQRLVAMTDGLSAQAAIGSRKMPYQRVRQLVIDFAAEQVGVSADDLSVHAELTDS